MPASRAVRAGAARAARVAAAAMEFASAPVGENTHQLAHLFAAALGAGNFNAGTPDQFLEVATALGAMILINRHGFPLDFNLSFVLGNVNSTPDS